MDDKEKFIEIFSGLDRAYGQTQSRSKNESGKLEAKSWIEKENLTKEKWLDHLEGREPSLGIIPIKDDNTCTWGAIDIDSYDGLDHKALIKKIQTKNFPLIVCKSKSGGAHIFLFVREPATAKEMQMKLTEICAWLGYGGSEIFPKQIELNSKGTGNFLNLPYNHPEYPTRYAFDDKGEALIELSEFCAFYETKVINNIKEIKVEKPVSQSNKDDFKGAPPCLLTLAEQGFSEGSRNMSLFQMGVYLRNRFPNELEDRLEGLIHISEVSLNRIEKVEDELKVGDTVTAKVIKLIPDEQKIGLSIKALKENTEETSEQNSEEITEENSVDTSIEVSAESENSDLAEEDSQEDDN